MLKVIGWTLLGCYLFVVGLGTLIYNHMLFFPPPHKYHVQEPVRLLDDGAGGKLAIWEEWNPDADFVLLYSHGNGESLGEVDFISDMFVENGFSFVAYDYSGYGHSSGKPTVKNTLLNIDRVYRYLTEEKGVAPERIVVMGNSIGSGPSTWLASEKKVGGLILQSAFTSIYRVPTWNKPIFLGSPYPNLRLLKDVDCPVLVIHGTKDTVIPLAHGESLFKAAKEPKIFLRMEDTGHNEVLLFADEVYWGKIRELLEKISG